MHMHARLCHISDFGIVLILLFKTQKLALNILWILQKLSTIFLLDQQQNIYNNKKNVLDVGDFLYRDVWPSTSSHACRYLKLQRIFFKFLFKNVSIGVHHKTLLKFSIKCFLRLPFVKGVLKKQYNRLGNDK